MEALRGAPERLGRFELRSELGSGSMGVVYEAWDSSLKRKVALKLLRVEGAAADPEEARQRLLREAQAMARMTHANVIAVYEVGEWEDRVFLVMELVEARADAGTLTRWLAVRPRTWREILAVYVQAGRGLAAAHDRELVHRDFKPDNVLVDAEGRARVTDFGLVGVTGGGDLPGREDDVGARLTRTGRLLGTPRFMAPEQHLAGTIDARTDQFAFCVSLWHALFGAWPFAGARYGELADNVIEGRVLDPPRGHRVPAWVERAVRRGLAADPAARWPAMSALLAAMTPPRHAGRRRAVGVAAGGAVAAVVALWAGRGGGSAPSGAPVDVAPVATARIAPLTTLGGCAFSPLFIDDETVLFDLTTDASVDLFTVAVTGGAPVQRTHSAEVEGFASRGRHPGEALYAVVYPDGDRPPAVMALDLATWKSARVPLPGFTPPAVAGGALYYPRADLKEIRRLRDGVDESLVTMPSGYALQLLASSPDGRWLAMTTGSPQSKRRVCLIDLIRPPVLDCLDAVAPEGRPVFTPDSRALWYVSSAGGIRVLELATRHDTVAVAEVQAEGGITLSPDGRRAVYSDCHATTELTDVSAAPARHLATGTIAAPDVSADGRIVWAGGADGAVVLRETDGTTRTIVPAAQGPAAQTAFDPSGGRIVFRKLGEHGGIYLADVTPFPPEPVTSNPNDFAPRFLDDHRIAFNRPVDGRVHVFIRDATTGSETRAHPGSRYLADVFGSRGTLLLFSADRHHVYEWDPATGRERELALPAAIRDGKLELRWARASFDDAAVLLQLGVQGGPLWRVPLDASGAARAEATLIWDAPDSVTVGSPAELPDGHLLVPVERWRGELHRVDLAPE